MDSEILDQLTILEKNVDSEVTKPEKGCKKKAESKINEVEESDTRDKRERLVGCVFTRKRTQERSTLNSKLMRWTVLMSIHF